jgi:predicted DNA-binding ribbon-helix-helix protein
MMSNTFQNFLSAPVIKRSVNIAGHATSVSLEQPFWDELLAIAATQKITLSQLIEHIDTARQTNLSSALRLYVLYQLKESRTSFQNQPPQ